MRACGAAREENGRLIVVLEPRSAGRMGVVARAASRCDARGSGGREARPQTRFGICLRIFA